jgi:hypothetical protein
MKQLWSHMVIWTLLLLFATTSYSQKIIYLNDNSTSNDVFTSAVGNDANSGTSPGTPVATLTKAMAEAVSGDRILVDAGTYPVTSVTVKSGVKLIGTANDLSVLTIQSAALSLQSNTQLWNLKIQRVLPASAAAPPTVSVATAPASGNILIENCLFFKNRTAIYLEPGSTEITIKRNRFDDNRTGILFPGSAGPTALSKLYIVDNELVNSRSYGMILTDNVNSPVEAYLSGNNITGNLAGGVEMDNNANGSRLVLRNNWFGSAAPTVFAGNTNGGFIVSDHNEALYFQNNNSLPNVSYPNQISGTNTASISDAVYATQANPRPATFNFISSDKTDIAGHTAFSFFPSIQDAISASVPEAVVTLPNGVYSDNIIVNKKVVIRGASRNAIIRGTYDYGNQDAVVAMNAAEAKLENLSITRDFGASSGVWQQDKRDHGVIINAINVSINEVTIQNQRNAIYAYSRTGLKVTNCLIEKNRTGFLLAVDLSSGIITNNIIRDNFTHGIMFNYDLGSGFVANDLKVKYNSFSGNWYTDIYANGAGAAGIYTGSDLSCNTFGTNNPATQANPAGEPAYGAQVPAQFAGTAPAFVASFAGYRIGEVATAPWLINTPVPASIAVSFLPLSATLNVSPVTGPLTAANNDYRILANAIGCVLENQTVNLSGNFKWNTNEAQAEWALGTNGKAGDGMGPLTGTGDNYTITPPAHVNGVTITSSANDATIQGPGDLPATSLETALFLNSLPGSSYKNWTISNIIFRDFDVAILADHNGGPIDVNDGFQILNNKFYIPADLNATAAASDNFQNIGIHYNYGKNIRITGNQFFIDGTGTSDDANSRYSSTYAIQSATSGGIAYDGLEITNNEFTVTGTPAPQPPVIKGIWDNGHNKGAGITISGNKFMNAEAGNIAANNRQTAFWVTSRSGASKNVVYQNNEVSNFSEGIAWLGGLYTSNTPPNFESDATPVQILNNKFNAVSNAVVIRKSAASPNTASPAKMNNNSFVGSVTNDINNQASGTADASCNWFDGLPMITGSVSTSPKLISGTDDNPGTIGFQTSAACEFPVKNMNSNETFATIQGAIDDPETQDNHVIFISNGTYNQRVTVSKVLTLTGESKAGVILDGTGLSGTGSGIAITSGKIGVLIEKLTIANFAGNNPNATAGIFSFAGNNNLSIKNVVIRDNPNSSGIYVQGGGGVSGIMIDGAEVSNHGPGARAIVIWDGFKRNVTIRNCIITNNLCCGIELQDGTASGVLIEQNTIAGKDNAIGLVGLTSGAGPNIIRNNTITVDGRFGIELKNPNGTGSTVETEDGAIVVRENTVTFSGTADKRDLAGIAVYRRGVVLGYGNTDVPTGVVISGNTVSGFIQSNADSHSEGFGIVVEGTNHKVTGNNLSGNDIDIQRQSGHLPYITDTATDGNQEDTPTNDQYFGRGNAPFSCGIEVSGNLGDMTYRDVAYLETAGVVVNSSNGETFCSIQRAVADGQTNNTHIINVGSGTFDEQILVNKSVTIKNASAVKPIVKFTGTPLGKPTVFDISADAVTIEGLNIQVELSKLKSAILASAQAIDQITVKDNLIEAVGVPSEGAYGDRNAVSVNYGGSTNYRVATNGVNNIVFSGNTVTGTGINAFRAGIAADESAGTFTDNTLQTINHDIIVRFASNGDVVIKDNQFNGGGVEVPEMNGSSGALTISGNVFDGTAANPVQAAMLRLKNNTNNKSVSVKDNTFTGHQWGISLENFQNVTIENNTMTPLSGSTTFRHVTVDTKELSSSSGYYAPVLGLTLIKNTFNGSGTTGGTGLAFYNRDNDNPSFGTFTIGGNGNENKFAAGLGTFIYLDEQTGPLALPSTPVTTMAPWTASFDASANQFDAGAGLQLPADMSLEALFTTEDKIVHKIDNSVLGFITVKTGNTFVTPLSFTAATATPKIQRGVDAASAGWTEHVKAGTYVENVDINKSLVLLGANFGINPKSARLPETIILPASSQPVFGNPAPVSIINFSGNSSGSTIDGFLIDGNNPALTSGVMINDGTTDVDATAGISAYNIIANTQVTNNIIRNINYSGILFHNAVTGAATTGNLISNNLIKDMRSASSGGIGVLIGGNNYTSVTNNYFEGVRSGIQTDNYWTADPGSSHSISGNMVEAVRRGIMHNNAYANAAHFIISNNTVTAYPGTTENEGIMISSLQGAVGATVEDNTVSGIGSVTSGYQLWNNPTSSTVIIKGGTVSNTLHGIFANNYDGYPAGTALSSEYIIDGVTINSSGTGIFIKDNTANTNDAIVKLTLAGNTTINQPVTAGIAISGKDAHLVTGPSQIVLSAASAVGVGITGTTSASNPNLILNQDFVINRNGNITAPVLNTDIDAIVEVNGNWTIPAGGPTYPFIIQGKLWFENGILNAENSPVYFTSNASDIVTGVKPEKPTSYILGKAMMNARLVNANAINFLGVDLPAGADLGNLAIDRITSSSAISPALAAGSINARWIITPQNTSAGRANVRFSFLSNFLNNQTASSLYAYRYSGTEWEIKSTVLTTTNNGGLYTTSAFNISAFSPWTFSSSSGPLPVTLTEFAVEKLEQAALLTWKTTSETNSSHFGVQHSTNGKSWLTLGTVAAQGESKISSQYTFTHPAPAEGENLYRLKMTDTDGTFTYSSIRSVVFSRDHTISFYPNPATERLTINSKEWNQVKGVKLVDMNGRVVYTSSGQSLSNFIDVKPFTAGMYVVEITHLNGSIRSSKVFIAK